MPVMGVCDEAISLCVCKNIDNFIYKKQMYPYCLRLPSEIGWFVIAKDSTDRRVVMARQLVAMLVFSIGLPVK